MEFVILGLNVHEGCYYIKVVYIKLIVLEMKQCEHECYIHHNGRPDIATTSFLLSPQNGHEDKQYMKIISRILLICFIIGIFTALLFVIVIDKLL